jgi:Zn-dependent peptidase ImmA (M78 family)
MMRVEVKRELFEWARERAGLSFDTLIERFPKLADWESGDKKPTLRQLEAFANATMAPLGYFFLNQPPEEQLLVPDFRTLDDVPVRRPSPNLLDTVYAMQRRQAWLRDERIEQGHEPLGFIRSTTAQAAPVRVAVAIRRVLGVVPGWAELHRTWSEALRALRLQIEEAGIVVVVNGVVGNNNHRKLDSREFRGFVLVDEYAPLIFVNGSDGKAAQMFTLAHELAHLWVGQDAVFNLRDMQPANVPVEQFCNRVAAEFLIPEAEMREAWRTARPVDEPYQVIARRFKVSELVAARRALDLRLINRAGFFEFYSRYLESERRTAASRSEGGDFYATQNARVGRVFAQAVVQAVREGRLLYRDAFELTGLQGATFDRYASKLGLQVGE